MLDVRRWAFGVFFVLGLKEPMKSSRIFFLTSLAMIAFASNSLLCRAGLKQTSIDAATFTSVRVFSGAAALWLIMKMRRTGWKDAGNWLSAAPFSGSILMLGAGVAWGIYSLWGKSASDAIAATAGNFLRAVPFTVAVSIIMLPWARLDRTGVGLAVISGAITSGLGYVIWYSALPGLKAAGAATVQLSVPILAAAGGILLLGEPITFRYLIASITVLGGIA